MTAQQFPGESDRFAPIRAESERIRASPIRPESAHQQTMNEASYKAAGRKLMAKRHHLYWVPCAAHSLDLMMEDIGKDKHVHDLVSKAQIITTFIYGHNRIPHMMRECTDGHDIIRPGPTRFASQFIALESLHKFRHELDTLIDSSEYLAHVGTLREESRDVAHEISCLVSDHRFWDRILYYLKLIEPLVQVLRMVDGEDKNDMGYLYEAMDKAKERLREKHPMAFQKWWRIIDARWESTLHHDLHVVGYFFNPRHQYSDSPHNDSEVLQGTINVISRLSRSTDERIDAMMEIDRFKLKLDIYRDYDLREAVNRMSPGESWVMLDYKTGQRNPLARIAIRVLSQTTSSS
ncbi:hypothetical protein Taro_004259 [Colocasia esculenta]|uniref:DUF659 domain-containing protein n=1 Tax=Colocasia esculenta TaxID=4460 RepID=A0A843TLJ0_COLES|nr:hypothetical protein [Colocasia esculenta]